MRHARSALFCVAFLCANWTLLTSDIAYRGTNDGGLIILIMLTPGVFILHQKLQRIVFGDGFMRPDERHSLWPAEAFILALAALLNWLLA